MHPDSNPACRALLTGAQALALALRHAGTRTAFAYPGTSELAICAALAGHGIRVINARGDKEAVFMAAGANRLRPGRATAVLHGARGLTNALGAICDVRRSEIPLVCVTGTASRHTAPYLPPHAEPDLIASAGSFASLAVDLASISQWDHRQFTRQLHAALAQVTGPVLLGLPQDLAETAFIPDHAVLTRRITPGRDRPRDTVLAQALITSALRPVVLIDDYLLTDDGTAECQLVRFASRLGAAVYQVSYRRGPMLFQQATAHRVPTLAGPYDPRDPAHRAALAETDLLITVEDRNMYPRVVGPLPRCPKIVISSNPRAAAKNGYLDDDTVVLAGPPASILRHLTTVLAGTPPAPGGTPTARHHTTQPADPFGRALVTAIAAALSAANRPVVTDDSQSFGALIARHYDLLPHATRIIASHGGFVGSGPAIATGAATTGHQVLCLLGDQGFTNGVQALATAAELGDTLVLLVCSNGTSQSLTAQASTSPRTRDICGTALLSNATTMSYTAIAAGYGMTTHLLNWPCLHTGPDMAIGGLARAENQLSTMLKTCLSRREPALIELAMCHCRAFWSQLWRTAGAEESEANPADCEPVRSGTASQPHQLDDH